MIKRFELEKYPVGYPKELLPADTHWDYKEDISDKNLIIHYEEGFGDTIMFIRFLPFIKERAKKIFLVLQPNLTKLIKNSDIILDNAVIYDKVEDALNACKGEGFVHMPLMDLPYPLGIEPKDIPFKDKYINSVSRVEFDKTKINIGIAYSGDKSANYNGRDIVLEEFYRFNKIKNVCLYSLQVGNSDDITQKLANNSIVDLGSTFTDFTDTANAISGLDLVITSDNVILNLAGAMGKKTYGVFNKYPNYRWFDLSGDNVVWYNSVKPFICKEENNWEEPMKEIELLIRKEYLNE